MYALSILLYLYRFKSFLFFLMKNSKCTSTQLKLPMLLVIVVDTATLKVDHYDYGIRDDAIKTVIKLNEEQKDNQIRLLYFEQIPWYFHHQILQQQFQKILDQTVECSFLCS
ncbi:unnamed protein product [Rotaria sp. Silwood2]|nr:unnamed protein product [Rotaria sp. Silwood2]